MASKRVTVKGIPKEVDFEAASKKLVQNFKLDLAFRVPTPNVSVVELTTAVFDVTGSESAVAQLRSEMTFAEINVFGLTPQSR